MKYLELRLTNGSIVTLNDKELVEQTIDDIVNNLYYEFRNEKYLKIVYKIDFPNKSETRELYIRKERLMTFEVFYKGNK